MSTTAIRAIITGTTGMVGEGVMHECLQDPRVEAVLVINRKTIGISHPKLVEILHADFYDFSSAETRLIGYNACFFCLGITSVGVSADVYYKITYTLTLALGTTLSRLNPGMDFCYVSGAGTDSTEKGRSRWARVKGKTENDLMKLSFRRVYAFRPGFIRPTKGLRFAHSFYRYVDWMYPLGRALYPNGFVSLRELGQAMIRVVGVGYRSNIITGKDIIELAKG